jgi:diguanylate cyclase (GGDEF)-like protein/PAS domain S-box-containing protein
MQIQFTPLVGLASIGAMLSIVIAYYAWRGRAAPAGIFLHLLATAMAWWLVGSALQLASLDPVQQNLLIKVRYLGVVVTPLAWILFAMSFSGNEGFVTKRNIALLCIEPFLTLGIVWSNPIHHLMWKTLATTTTLGDPWQMGPWNLLNRVYTYVLSLLGMVVLLRKFLRSPGLYKKQIGALLIGIMTPLLCEFLTLTGASPWPGIEITDFGLSVGGMVIVFAFVRYRLLDIVPAARDTVIESMADAVIVLDMQSRILDVNPAAEKILGQSASYLVGKETQSVFQEQGNLLERSRNITEGHAAVTFSQDGREKAFDLRISPLYDRERKPAGRLLVLRDVTQRVRTEKALRESEERYALAAQGSNDGLWDWDLRTNKMHISPRWKAMLGYDDDEIGHAPEEWLDRIKQEDAARVRRQIQEHLKGLTPNLEIEHRIRRKDGTYCWVLGRGLAVRDEHQVPYRMAGSLTDISERKQAEEKLVYDAFHDALTGLHNRAMFMERLEATLTRSLRRRDSPFAVLFLDLDRFKVVNDSLGHAIGDKLLIEVAGRLRDSLRQVDTIARLGGDEFGVLLEDIGQPAQAVKVAERILKALGVAFDLEGHTVFTTASIGIALSGSHITHPEEMLRDADIAMYRAKQLGRSCYVVFDKHMYSQARYMMQIEGELREAVERGELEVYYQPIVALRTSDVLGMEALLRWRHPQRGLLLPDEFLHAAEDSELILPIGYCVLREACLQTANWQEEMGFDPPLTVSVNLSRRQLRDPELIPHVQSALAETGLLGGCLILEITEDVMMEDAAGFTDILKRLKQLGVRLHMDDFGARYSSLSVLNEFPFDSIKIDRSFVGKLQRSKGDVEIVRAMIQLGHSLSKHVVAEGVETEEELAHLRTVDCDYGQGFYFCVPGSASEVEAFLKKMREDSHAEIDSSPVP